jgi:glycosyltransferase involved in cell wall biosynthesis
MRIIHWYPRFLAGGAIAETVLGLANAQTLLGHQVLVVCHEFDHSPAYNLQLRSHLAAELHTWQPTLAITVGKMPASLVPRRSVAVLRKYNADILHIHNGVFLEDALARQFIPRARAVLTAHGAFYPLALTRNLRAYVALLKPFFYNRLAAFHALSPDEASVIRKLFRCREVYVVPSGLSDNFGLASRTHGDSDDAPQGTLRLVSVGRLDIRTKGLDILLHSFASAAVRSAQRLELLLVGPRSGRDCASILGIIDQLGIADRVSITGLTDREGVARYLKKSDVFVQTSRWDAFSLAAIEAMALDLPCILSSRVGVATYPNIAALPQIHITEPQVERVTAAMLEVVNSVEEQKEAARQFGPALREFFSWERAAREHERAYSRLMAN